MRGKYWKVSLLDNLFVLYILLFILQQQGGLAGVTTMQAVVPNNRDEGPVTGNVLGNKKSPRKSRTSDEKVGVARLFVHFVHSRTGLGLTKRKACHSHHS
jgi:hypothetical protein